MALAALAILHRTSLVILKWRIFFREGGVVCRMHLRTSSLVPGGWLYMQLRPLSHRSDTGCSTFTWFLVCIYQYMWMFSSVLHTLFMNKYSYINILYEIICIVETYPIVVPTCCGFNTKIARKVLVPQQSQGSRRSEYSCVLSIKFYTNSVERVYR